MLIHNLFVRFRILLNSLITKNVIFGAIKTHRKEKYTHTHQTICNYSAKYRLLARVIMSSTPDSKF